MFDKLASNYWFRAGSFSLLNRLSITGFGIISFLLLIRTISLEEMGIWSLFLSVTGVLESIRNAFIYSPLIKYYTDALNDSRIEIASSSFILNLIIGATHAVILLIIGFTCNLFWEAPGLNKLYILFAVSALIYSPYSHLQFLQQAKGNFKGTFTSNFIQKLIPFLYIVTQSALNKSINLSYLVLYYNLGYLISLVAISISSTSQERTFLFTTKHINSLLNFGKYTLGTNLCSMINKNLGEWIIGGFIGIGGVAIYNPAIRMINLIEIPLSTASQIIYPKLVQKLKVNKLHTISPFFLKSTMTLVLLILPFVLLSFFFSEGLIELIAGEQYIESAKLLKYGILAGLFIPIARQFGILLNASEFMNWNFYFMFGVTVISALTSFILINIFGIAGAIYSIITISILAAFIALYILKKQFGFTYILREI